MATERMDRVAEQGMKIFFSYVRGFFKEDSLVPPKDKSSTLLYEAESNSKLRSGWALRRPPCKDIVDPYPTIATNCLNL